MPFHSAYHSTEPSMPSSDQSYPESSTLNTSQSPPSHVPPGRWDHTSAPRAILLTSLHPRTSPNSQSASGSELAWWLKRPDSPKRCHVDHLASLGNTHIWTSGHSSNWWWQCYPSSLLSATSPLPHSPAGPPSTGMPAWSWHRLFHGQTVLKPCQVKYKCSLLLTDDLNQSRTFLIFFSVYFCVLTHLWSKDSFPISNKNITLLSPSQTPVS